MEHTAVSPLAAMSRAAEDPTGYVEQWKARTGGRAIAAFPMNFPAEIAHAAGLLPVIVQEDRNPITLGNNLLSEFNCGYSRNLADQAATGRLDAYDGFFMADHCIQLIGAADVIRELTAGRRFYFGQLISSMNDPWTTDQARLTMTDFVDELSSFAGVQITDERLRESIKTYNRGRRLLRALYEQRRSGDSRFTSGELQTMVKSSMVMQREEHNALLEELVAQSSAAPRDDRVRVHLSGHFCHAPKPELLEVIEESGGIVVDDDLFHGARYISTDADESGSPVDALVGQYLDRNVNIPCPTRAQSDVDWDTYLLNAVHSSGAEVVISLLVKYCEPHMLYLPELRKALEAKGIPHLLLETEHEGMPLETMRTRIEAMFEQAKRSRTLTRVPTA
ncbi:2-hydroxyacyl-CoA dehydratase subunit D [Prauserella flavalba]|uniref:Benzoyl-CoA reductase n=1 Tax=Prauserella flavalba TaxID=1477506 RepID=A0A318LGY7_9PSEU|nr:2-hydroxyacyl-CoA dehydratase family protein [Prauserella flavalba]PXY18416.1 benzoyl-CoA reductase [Prauserella flavalba]